MRIRKLTTVVITLSALSLVTACDEKPLSYGDVNSIIAIMSPDEWDAVSQDIYDALEPTITTVRAEKTFTVTYQEPYAEYWDRLRRFRQLLVVGSRKAPWVQTVLDEADEPVTENGMYQMYNVWSMGQNVTLILLDEGWGPNELAPYLGRVQELLDRQYREYARSRMYFSGVDSALADTLAMQAGFTMLLPDVYEWEVLDSTYIFRNDNPDPAELIRQIAVSWRTPAPGLLDREAVLEWRAEVVDLYSEPQMVVLDAAEDVSFDFAGVPGYELQAQWRNPPDRPWPAGGPIITRSVTCDNQDRTYLLDAWLYAPGKEKYEYMIQLETLLNTFRCTS
jgi:Domain of unknown function (DUF4837)